MQQPCPNQAQGQGQPCGCPSSQQLWASTDDQAGSR